MAVTSSTREQLNRIRGAVDFLQAETKVRSFFLNLMMSQHWISSRGQTFSCCGIVVFLGVGVLADLDRERSTTKRSRSGQTNRFHSAYRFYYCIRLVLFLHVFVFISSNFPVGCSFSRFKEIHLANFW
jgi:hypothetical protein